MRRRIVLATSGTLAGLAALVAAKSGGHPLDPIGGLPSAALAGPGATTSAPPTISPAPPAAFGRHRDHGGVPPAQTYGPVAPPAGTPLATSRAGTYTGTAVTTRYGVVQARITVTGGRLARVAFVQLTGFDGHSQEINTAAGPTLLHETLVAQSARIDTVSGATYTSDGYRTSLQAALDAARR